MIEGAKASGPAVKFADPTVSAPHGVVDIPARPDIEWKPRRIYVKPNDCLKYGYTDGCRGCMWLQHGLGAKAGHNDECRKRIETAFASDPDDKWRVEQQKAKMDEYVAAEGEKLIVDNNEPNDASGEIASDGQEKGVEAREDDIEPSRGPGSSSDKVLPPPLQLKSPEAGFRDAPSRRSDRRVPTPPRNPPKKRGSTSQDKTQ